MEKPARVLSMSSSRYILSSDLLKSICSATKNNKRLGLTGVFKPQNVVFCVVLYEITVGVRRLLVMSISHEVL
jgi:hypothetical protein